jgi:transcriptional regulator with XRE-family HTH domain
MPSTRLRAVPDASSTAFGDLLCRLRLAREVTVLRERERPAGRIARWTTTAPLSQNELARRAGLDPALIWRLEAGTHARPLRATVEKLIAALDLDAVTSCLLLIAAGYWPWTQLDEDTAALVAQTAISVLAGDYRVMEGS